MPSITALLPVLVLLTVLAAFAWIGYQIHIYTTTLASRTTTSLSARNISLAPDAAGNVGMRIGVQHMDHDAYAGKVQAGVVNAWNMSRWPAYKSRFWNKDAGAEPVAEVPSRSRAGSRPGVGSRSASGVGGAAGSGAAVASGASAAAAAAGSGQVRPLGPRAQGSFGNGRA